MTLHNPYLRGRCLTYPEAALFLGAVSSHDLGERMAELESMPWSLLTPAEKSEAKTARLVLRHRGLFNANPL